jgi:hypothetical protein
MTAYYIAALPVVVLIAIVAWRRARRRREDRPEIEAWLENFSPGSYLPMLRLANSGDSGYLNTRCGPEAAARYRQRQRRMLREYLRGLSRDFRRLHTVAAENAWRTRISVWIIELRLVLDKFSPCTINPLPLLANVDELTARAREITRRRLEFRLS